MGYWKAGKTNHITPLLTPQKGPLLFSAIKQSVSRWDTFCMLTNLHAIEQWDRGGKWIQRPDTLISPNAALVILVRLQLLCLPDPAGLTWLIMKGCICLRGLTADWTVRWSSHHPPSRDKDIPREGPVYSWRPITHLLHDCSSGCHFMLITLPLLQWFSKLWSYWKGTLKSFFSRNKWQTIRFIYAERKPNKSRLENIFGTLTS